MKLYPVQAARSGSFRNLFWSRHNKTYTVENITQTKFSLANNITPAYSCESQNCAFACAKAHFLIALVTAHCLESNDTFDIHEGVQ